MYDAMVIVMVGLPARGKSHTATKLKRYISWLGMPCSVFNVGQYRRKLQDSSIEKTLAKTGSSSADFFDPDNAEGMRMRQAAAEAAMHDLLTYLQPDRDDADRMMKVAIFDATNSTKERRKWIMDTVKGTNSFVLFVELVSQEESALVESGIRRTKATGSDYTKACQMDMPLEEAVKDFRKRIAHYMTVYQECDPQEGISFVRCVDLGAQWHMHWPQTSRDLAINRIVHFLFATNQQNEDRLDSRSPASANLNFLKKKKTVWMARHGESEWNVKGLIGGDSCLTARGLDFAHQLGAHLARHASKNDVKRVTLWTSSLKRTQETAQILSQTLQQNVENTAVVIAAWKALDELNAGDTDSMRYDQIKDAFPEFHAARMRDKFVVRFPGVHGESYADLLLRLHPVIIELERTTNTLCEDEDCGDEILVIIGHQAVLRCLLAYAVGLPWQEAVWREMPLHQVWSIDLGAMDGCSDTVSWDTDGVQTSEELINGVSVKRLVFPVAAVSTHLKQQQQLAPPQK